MLTVICHRDLRSPAYWGRVDTWRKREAFIALVRHLKGFPSDYRQWDCFLFDDYIMRQQTNLTFLRRHLPLSDGNDEEHFGDAIDFDWDAHAYVPRKRKRSSKPLKKKKKPTPKAKVLPKSTKPKGKGVMVYDVEKGCLVPIASPTE